MSFLAVIQRPFWASGREDRPTEALSVVNDEARTRARTHELSSCLSVLRIRRPSWTQEDSSTTEALSIVNDEARSLSCIHGLLCLSSLLSSAIPSLR